MASSEVFPNTVACIDKMWQNAVYIQKKSRFGKMIIEIQICSLQFTTDQLISTIQCLLMPPELH